MNTHAMRTLLAAIPILLLCSCGGGGGGSADSQAIVMNSQLAIASNYLGGVVGVGTTAFALVNELEQNGVDLNGDGDFADNVVFMIDSVTGQRTNLGVSATNGLAKNDTHIAWGVLEGSEGGVDLNGDGDIADRVLTIFDPSQPVGPMNPMNTGITMDPTTPLRGSGNTFAFISYEVNEGADLNGDLDQNDFVVQMFNTATMTAFNTALSTTDFNFVTRFDLVLFTADEASQSTGMMGGGADLDGNGDATGTILFVADSAAATVSTVGGVGGRNILLGSYRIYGTAMDPAFVYSVPEQGTSLNIAGLVNDTDTSDTVCAIFKYATMTEFFPGGGLAVEGLRYSGSSTTMTLSVIESENTDNGFDFNNDGDTDDLVPFWVDLSVPGIANNIVLAQDDGATGLPLVCGTSVLLRASEGDQGPNGTNFNVSMGDTDTNDFVFFHVDTTLPGATPTSLNLAGEDALCAAESPDFVTVVASEADNGGSDFNADGDTSDQVSFYFPITNGVISTTGRRIGATGNTVLQDCGTIVRYVSFAPEGSSPAFGDVNQDGDFDDYVLQTIKVRKSDGETIATSVLGTVEVNTGENDFPLILSNMLLAFPSGESTIGPGVNFNANQGDPDMSDTILFLGRLDCP